MRVQPIARHFAVACLAMLMCVHALPAFAARLAVNGSFQRTLKVTGAVNLDVTTGSQADVQPDPAGGWIVHQDGPLRLWDAVEDTLDTWQAAGSPHQSGFGLTATKEHQRIWLGDPDGPSWDLPA